MLSIHCDSEARSPNASYFERTPQFDDQFPQIDGQRAGEGEALPGDRVDEAQPGGVERLAGEADPREERANRRRGASIDWVPQ